MLGALGRFVVRRRVAVLVVSVLAMATAGAVGGGVAQHLTGGGFEDPGAESAQAGDVLEEAFGATTPNLVLLVTAPTAGRSTLRPRPRPAPLSPPTWGPSSGSPGPSPTGRSAHLRPCAATTGARPWSWPP